MPPAKSASRRPLILLIAVLLVGGWVYFQFFRGWAIQNSPPPRETIVMLGDSLTAGVGASSGRTWPEQLSATLGKPVISAGISGDTTVGGLARLDRDVLAHNPGTVIVCLGGNDILRRVPLEDTVQNLDRILERVSSQGSMVVLVGVQGLPFLSSHRSRYRDLARKHGAIFVPNILGGILGNRSLMSDEVHPNSEGYAIMTERVAKAMGKYLQP